MTRIAGTLVHGLGQAKNLTQIEWVRRQLIECVGIDPYPGTLNLDLRDDENRGRWREWCRMPGEILEPEETGFCFARCFPVRIEGRIPAAVLLPDSPDYPAHKVELVAALQLRSHLSLSEHTSVSVELCRPLAVDAVLFDIDGTLVDSVGAYYEVARLAAEPFGVEVTCEQVRRALATGKNFWKGVIPQERQDGGLILKEMSAYAAREWPRVLHEFGAVFNGVEQTLDALHDRGIRLGIVSGARPEVLELLREKGVLDRFDAVILGGDVTRGKPDPEGINLGLSRLKVKPGMALYVGDTPIDIQASRVAGVHAVGVLTGAADSATLSTYEPDRLIATHAGLPAIVTGTSHI